MKEQRYCCFCGRELVLRTLYDGSKEKYCDECDQIFFRAPSPCVIVMVTSADKVLLARGIRWNHTYWALTSGHIRRGETAEETAIREVYEEVGLEICGLEFLRTYATKHRALLMIAFKAETEKTSIKKSQELEDARWFNLCDPLPLSTISTAAHVVQHVFPNVKYMDVKELEKMA